MDNTRQDLVDECDMLKLSAGIAFKARQDMIESFVADIIAKNGSNGHFEICKKTCSDDISKWPQRVSIKATSIHHYINIDFNMYNDNTFDANARVSGVDYTAIYGTNNDKHSSSNNLEYIAFAKLFIAIVDSLDSLDILLNSDTAMSCTNDIQAYLDAQLSIKKYDDAAFEAKKNAIKESFCAGTRIRIGSYPASKVCRITKVCKKRLYVDNYKRFFDRPCQKTIDKDDAATLIANGNWSLVQDV